MQETITTTPDDELPPSRPRRFRLIALGLVLTLFVPFAYVAYRNIADAISNPDPAPGFPEPDFSLTHEEAIQTFQRLATQLRQAIENRDISLAASVTTAGGNAGNTALSVIRRLQKAGVVDRTRVETRDIRVVTSGEGLIQLREVTLLRSCFESESGDDVTDADAVIEQTNDWTMGLEDDRWLLDDGQLIDDKVVDGNEAHCRR